MICSSLLEEIYLYPGQVIKGLVDLFLGVLPEILFLSLFVIVISKCYQSFKYDCFYRFLAVVSLSAIIIFILQKYCFNNGKLLIISFVIIYLMIIRIYSVKNIFSILKIFILLIMGTLIDKVLSVFISNLVFIATGFRFTGSEISLIYILYILVSKIIIETIIIAIVFKFAQNSHEVSK
jgi:hypothetical protein